MMMARLIGVALSVALVSVAGAADAQLGVKERYQLEEAQSPVRDRAGWKKPKAVLLVGMPDQVAQAMQTQSPGVQFLRASSAAEAKALAPKADALVGACSADILAAGQSIRWVQVINAGVEDCVRVPAMRDRDVLLTNMQRILGPVIAEHVIALTLGLTRGLNEFVPAQGEHQWRREPTVAKMSVIQGKTMLVVGLGGLGTEIARRGHALGMKVIATRASGRSGPDFVSYVGLPDELHKLAAQADIVVNATPLTPETTDLFGAAFFSKMKSTAHFINVGRGKSVVTDALVEALSKGRIAGAGLDVTEPEPLPSNHALWRLSNVIITPHVSSVSDLGLNARYEVATENVRRYVSGERMLSVVDVSKGY